MSFSDENLAELFSQARNQKPVASLDETKKAFVTATVVAAGGVLATKGLLHLLTAKKWIIMLSTITIITTGTLIVSLSPNPEEAAENAPSSNNSIAAIDQSQPENEVPVDASPYLEPGIPIVIAEDDPYNIIEDEPNLLNAADCNTNDSENRVASVGQLNVSSTFSPNADGINDLLLFSYLTEDIEAFHCVILNRWGVVVAELNDINLGWDGISKDGTVCNTGTYFYKYEATTASGGILEGHGSTQLTDSNRKIKSYSQRFEITENTTKADFENIKKDAEKDGIDFTYKAKYNNGKLTKLRLELKIPAKENGESKYVMTSLKIEGGFNYTVAWENSEDGQVTDIYCGDTDELEKENEDDIEEIEGAIEETINEIEELIEGLELDGLFANLDSLTHQMTEVAELHWAEMEDEMALLEKELELAVEELNEEEIQTLMNEISQSSAELVKALQEEIQQIQIEIEEEQKEKKEEMEKKEKEDKKDEKEKKDEKGTRI